MSKYHYYQVKGGEEAWKPCPVAMRKDVEAKDHPAFFTVLAVDMLADELPAEDREKLKYTGPLYFDWDGEDMVAVAEQVYKLCLMLEAKGLNMACASLYATGGRGFHLEIPMACFLQKYPKDGLQYLPVIYKQLAFELAVDSLDFRVYSGGRGRMWRSPNVKRDNGHYKVGITYDELKEITLESYEALTSQPREPIKPADPEISMELTVMFDRAQQEVKAKLAKRKKKTANVNLKGRDLPSIEALLEGRGVKPEAGFHQIALQLAILAEAMGWSEAELATKAEGLAVNHQSDGHRYNTPGKRKSELVRMHRYIEGNPCYDFSIGGIKSLLSHEAPDLDGIPVSKEDIEENIQKAADAPAVKSNEPTEYDDVSASVDLSKFGVYTTSSEDGSKKRICAISFEDVHILRSASTGLLSCYEAMVLVNGKKVGRQTLEVETFAGLQSFNKFASRHSHAFQGTDVHVRALMMKVADKGRKEGKTFFVVNREGLDMINVVNHEDPEMREPFMVWADGKGVVVEPRIAAKGFEFSFQGYPDPKGVYRTDISDAPSLPDWIEEPGNLDVLRSTLDNFMDCQQPNVIAKMLGWYVATFYRMLFHKVYNKFPILHINGAAGAGKTEMNLFMFSLFFYQQEAKSLTPTSTMFALQQQMAGSSSIPLMIDEYKPHEMPVETHGRLKLMMRDAYNCRDITRGGGTRDNDDYRSLYNIQLSAPMVVVAEASEEEAAVMERVVLCTVVRPPASTAMKWSTRFHLAQRNKRCLSILGQYMAADIVQDYDLPTLTQEFDKLLLEAQDKYMLSEKDFKSGLDEEAIKAKQGAKERTVFNYTVARFGLQKLRALVQDIFKDGSYEERFDTLELAVYERMADLLPSTQAEWVKVMSDFASMSIGVDNTSPMAVRKNIEYAFGTAGGKTTLELSARVAYSKYRTWCRSQGKKALFPSDSAFIHGLKDCAAFLRFGPGEELKQVPGGVFVFDMDELTRMGVEQFKET